MAILNFSGWQPPLPSDFDGSPYPRLWWYPKFFRQSDRTGCKRDHLDAHDHSTLRFGGLVAQEKILLGWLVTTPPKPPPGRRGLNFSTMYTLFRVRKWTLKCPN